LNLSSICHSSLIVYQTTRLEGLSSGHPSTNPTADILRVELDSFKFNFKKIINLFKFDFSFVKGAANQQKQSNGRQNGQLRSAAPTAHPTGRHPAADGDDFMRPPDAGVAG